MTLDLHPLHLDVLRRLKAAKERSLPFASLCPDSRKATKSVVAEALRELRHNGLVALRRDNRWEITREGHVATYEK